MTTLLTQLTYLYNMSNMSNPTEVLIKITHPKNELLLDFRIIPLDAAEKLNHFFISNPNFVVSLSGPHDWEEYLKSLKLELIHDQAILTAFRTVFPQGLNTRPIYDDIWHTKDDNDTEAAGSYSDSDDN